MKPKVTFFTLTCGGEDYEFLLGAIEHHAEMGSHLVLDTTPPERAIRFKKLPDSVIWLHELNFGSGWKEFRLRSAVERAMRKAKAFYADVLVSVDSDEFFTKDSEEPLFLWAMEAKVEVECVHWQKGSKPYTFGHSEWHRRLWPGGNNVVIAENIAWQSHALSNGNPEHHHALGSKALEVETAATTIEGWPDKGTEVSSIAWPAKLALWRDKGILPSESCR